MKSSVSLFKIKTIIFWSLNRSMGNFFLYPYCTSAHVIIISFVDYLFSSVFFLEEFDCHCQQPETRNRFSMCGPLQLWTCDIISNQYPFFALLHCILCFDQTTIILSAPEWHFFMVLLVHSSWLVLYSLPFYNLLSWTFFSFFCHNQQMTYFIKMKFGKWMIEKRMPICPCQLVTMFHYIKQNAADYTMRFAFKNKYLWNGNDLKFAWVQQTAAEQLKHQ